MSVRPSIASVVSHAKWPFISGGRTGRGRRKGGGAERSAEGPQGFANVLNKANGELRIPEREVA